MNVEAPDSLRSTAFARILDLLSEGEIEGLVNGLQSVYLDGTPLHNPDGSANFSGITVETRPGTPGQTPIPGFPETESELGSPIEVKAAVPITHTITNAAVDAVRVRLTVPSLLSQDPKTGDISGTSVEIAIDVQANGGGFVTQKTDVITGKTRSPYQRSYRIPLSGPPPWDVRVRRITADAATVDLLNKTVWTSYTEITDEQFIYPNSALAFVSVDAQQFSAIPTRGYDIKGIRCRIPSNYNPLTRVYTGTWDGTFQVAWTDNPAWCFYDLLTHPRYGLGLYLAAAQVDKWAFYAIGRYCDGLVPDGHGGTEPRFTCNLYLQTQEEAFLVLTSMASIFRGMAYWASGTIVPVQDAPADPVALFTESNVEGGLFTYSGSAKSARHTVAIVDWNDPADGYQRKPEYVENRAGILRYGVVPITVTAVGCTSRGQAHRMGDWLLYTETSETDLVVFRTGLDGIYVAPGKIVAVTDQHRAGLRFGGRLAAASASSVTVDKAVTIEAGKTYSLQVVLPDGTLATRTVTNSPGTTAVLSITPVFAVPPIAPAVWVLTSSDLSPVLYRVLSVLEVERNKYEITGVAHNPSKFGNIEAGLTLVTPKTSTVTLVPAAPANVVIAESLAIVAGAVKVVLSVSWEAVPGASRYVVEYRRDSGNYVSLPEVSAPLAEVVDVVPGFYEVRVFARNILSGQSAPATATKQLLGKTAPPADVAGFVVARNGDDLIFSWQSVPDLDVDHYELRGGDAWASAVPLGQTINTSFTIKTHQGGTYLVKAFDTSRSEATPDGNESLHAAAVIIPANTDINVVVTANDAPAWAGTKTHTRVDGSAVTLEGQKTWADLTQPWTSYTKSWAKTADPNASGTYVTVPIDVGAVMTSRVEIAPVIEQHAIAGAWADLTQPWMSYTNSWSGPPGAVEATYELATSMDGSTYTAFSMFVPGFYTARFFKFRITLMTNDRNYVPLLTDFLVTVDVPDRALHFEDQVCDASTGLVLTFSPAFVNVQTVNPTIQGGSIGDTYRVTAKTNTGTTIKVYDAAGAQKASLLDVDVFGYGTLA